MATLAKINSPVWGISTSGYGEVVEGVPAIRQRMDIAIRTTKGSDPLRPQFGSKVYKYIDAPLSLAIPNIKREILECLDIWVKDIVVTGITSFLKNLSNPVFEITFRTIDDTVLENYVFDFTESISNEAIIKELIVQAFIPENPLNFRYKFQFDTNGNQVMPYPPVSGFATVSEMFAWITENYSYLGRWFLLSDRIVGYLSPDDIHSASLNISVLANLTRFEAPFPVLADGEFYKVVFTINGLVKESFGLLTTPGETLGWIISNWSQYATWSVQYFVSNVLAGEFSDEFSDEFLVQVGVNNYNLIGYTVVPGITASLQIVKV